MKRILLGMLALHITHVSFAADVAAVTDTVAPKITTVKLPPAVILRHELKNFPDFVERTQIDRRLAGKELDPMGVVLVVELALHDYNVLFKQPEIATIMRMNKPRIIRSILQGFPEAIKELEVDGFLRDAGSPKSKVKSRL